MSLKENKAKESAVSPVVGVMLMLVVTIIIAAVVAAFATGLSANAEPAPAAALSVSIKADDTHVNDLIIKHLSGDPLVTKDLKLSFSWPGHDGNTYSASSDDGSAASPGWEDYKTALFTVGQKVGENQFGNSTLTTGYYIESMKAYDSGDGTITDAAMKLIFGSEFETLKKGTPVQVTVLHIPSNQLIYKKEVIAA